MNVLLQSQLAGEARAKRPAFGLVRSATIVTAVQGWTCDRVPGGMTGSGFLAEAAATRFGLDLRRIGTPGQVADLGWREALHRAAPTLDAAAEAVRETIETGRPHFAFLNRCGTSIATLPPLIAAYPDAVLVWVDAHGDYNTPETTPTGYLGGMVVSALSGLWNSGYGSCLTPDRAILVGTRDLDPLEEALLRRDRVAIVNGTTSDLDVASILRLVGGRPVMLHIDLDVIDPVYVPAEYAVPGGLHPAVLRRLVRGLAASVPVVSLEISEFELPADPVRAACGAATVMSLIEPLFG
jgi:arginase/N-omega-hydroxy-L-arginine amidinohydrolase